MGVLEDHQHRVKARQGLHLRNERIERSLPPLLRGQIECGVASIVWKRQHLGKGATPISKIRDAEFGPRNCFSLAMVALFLQVIVAMQGARVPPLYPLTCAREGCADLSAVGQQRDPLAPPGRRLAAVADSNLAISVRGERWSSGVRGDRSCGRRGAGSAGVDGGAGRAQRGTGSSPNRSANLRH